MLKVTERAAQELEKMLREKAEAEDDCLRLVTEDGVNFAIGVGKPKEGDHFINYNDKRVLVVSGILASHLNEATVGIKETPQGPEIVVFMNEA
jgi:Fe-S cluster assembly iron-binding protein IscA